jgi:putative phage-type endonuclease
MRVIELKQNTPEWHSWRLDGIGGSDAPVIEGSSPYSTPRQLAIIKRDRIVSEDSENEFIFAKGHRTESLVRKNFAELTGIVMEPLCAVHDKFDHIRTSMDGFDKVKYGVLEAKLVGKAVLEEAREDGKVPRHHFVQLQHNMEVAGVDLGQWYGHNGSDNGILIEVKRDPKFISEQLQKEHDFWGMIKEGKLPPLTDRDELIPEDLALLNEIYEAKVLMDNAKEYFESLKAKLDSYGHPKLRGAGIVAYKAGKNGSIDYKKIPGVKRRLEKYSERYLEKFRSAPSEPSWNVSIETKEKKNGKV